MMRCEIILLLATASLGFAAKLEGLAADCHLCPNVTTQHLRARACTPVTQPGECCPSHWTCETHEQRGLSPTSCVYDKTYQLGEAVPVGGLCRRGCQCRKGLLPADPAHIECANVECPETYLNLRPGCRPTFSHDTCCATGYNCLNVTPPVVNTTDVNGTVTGNITVPSLLPTVIIEEPACFADGREYLLGQKVFFHSHACQMCICTEDFVGPFGPNCTTLDCGIAHRNQEHLRLGCTPLYIQGSCCPADWICPGHPAIIPNNKLIATGKEDPTTHCTLGDWAAPKGGFLNMYDCNVSCKCLTPPSFTCVRYPTCPMAVNAESAP